MSANEYYIVLVYAVSADYDLPPSLEHSATRTFDTVGEATTYRDLFTGMVYLRTHVQWVKIDSTYGVMTDE